MAFTRKVIERLRGLAFPAAIEHDDIHMAGTRRISLARGLAADEAGGVVGL